MAKITSQTGEYIHVRLGTELGAKFHQYHHATKFGKTAVVNMLIRRFLEARDNGDRTISIVI